MGSSDSLQPSAGARPLLLLLLTVHLAAARLCLHSKCECVWQKNKLAADCSNKKLAGLPEDPESVDVQSINLTRTDVFELSRNIFSDANFVNLQKIYIQKVGLEVVNENAFHKLSNLIELDLSLNNLKAVPTPSFRPIAKLRTLDLSSNRIESLPNNSFANLTNLKTLSLERNRIKFIDDDAFVGLLSLESLKLSENKLSYIRSQTLIPLNRVHSLTLSDNPWKCDCALKSVRKYLLANGKINVDDQPKCEDNQQIWTLMGLDSFLCPPVISNASLSPKLTVNEGSTLRLECSVHLTEEDDMHLTSFQWYWKNIPIYNNSKGCGTDCFSKNQSQYFRVFESNNRHNKLKVSRLELSSVQTFNSGHYLCVAKNSAGNAQKVFRVDVSGQYTPSKITTASASSKSYINEELETKDNTTDNLVLGLILAVIFGILLIIILLGISIIMFCRRRRRRNSSERNSSVNDGTELEKLTDNSNLSLKVNPIQKPPRMTFETYNSDKDIPQVWLIKHNINGNSNIMNDQSYAESDYSTQLLFNDNYNDSQNYSDSIIEPDVIHPSAYVRERHIQVTDLDKLSVHSDGTEV